jgi:hypothetical protein
MWRHDVEEKLVERKTSNILRYKLIKKKTWVGIWNDELNNWQKFENKIYLKTKGFGEMTGINLWNH